MPRGRKLCRPPSPITLSALEVDAAGLDAMERRYLKVIAMNYGGGDDRRSAAAEHLHKPTRLRLQFLATQRMHHD